jgi:hypothetical protein
MSSSFQLIHPLLSLFVIFSTYLSYPASLSSTFQLIHFYLLSLFVLFFSTIYPTQPLCPLLFNLFILTQPLHPLLFNLSILPSFFVLYFSTYLSFTLPLCPLLFNLSILYSASSSSSFQLIHPN